MRLLLKKWAQAEQSSALKRGFTLIEMSIVLVVIGLIIGGVLKGQEVINSSREKAVINDAAKIKAAVLTFYDRYQYFPGDYPYASTRIDASVPDGNGDGFVARDNGDLSQPRNQWRRGQTGQMQHQNFKENQIAWLHLGWSSILDITDLTVDNLSDETFPDGAHPSAHWEIGHSTGALRNQARPLPRALWLRYAAWDQNNNPRPDGVLTPKQAFAIDRKLDDGRPFEDINDFPEFDASVFASYGRSYGSNDCGRLNPQEYSIPEVNEKSCFMLFKVLE